MERIKTDICVIGAGSGGLSVAAGAVQMGARVVLVEGGEMGGDCLNTGCVPSKALLATAHRAHQMRSANPFGIAPVEPQIDAAGVRAHVADVIRGIAPVDSQERFEGLGVRVIRAWAKFVSPTELQAGDAVIEARRFVIATGSRPFVPDVPGLADVPYLTNESLFDLTDFPSHLLIIGGGPIGMEMAQAHRRLGSKVTVIEAGRALGREDSDLARELTDCVTAEGVILREEARAARVERTETGVAVVLEDGERIEGSHLLVAVGRVPDHAKLDPAAAGIRTTRTGIEVDERLRSSNRRVYAIGDAAGGMQFTHLAGYHASVVIRALLFGLPSKVRHDHIPRVTYTDPELAQVGLTEAEARAQYGGRLEIVTSTFEENDRARAEGRTTGRIKLYVVGGRPVGVTLLGAHAGELIGVWALALSQRMKISAIAGMIAPYPTLGEINKRAAGAYFTPRLFENPWVKRVVGAVQRYIP